MSGNSIGARISFYRNEHGWTQADLAERMGTSQQQVARFESGKYDIKSSTLVALASTLGVSVTELLGLQFEPYINDGVDDSDPSFVELRRIYSRLPDDGRERLLSFARWALGEYPGETLSDGVAKTA